MNKIQNYITTIIIALIFAFGGYYFGVRGYEVRVGSEVKEIEIINKEKEIPAEIDFAKFWQVWDMVNTSHITKPLDPRTLLDGAIEGMVASIGDPYTSYLNVEKNKEIKSDLNGLYEGIGAQLGFDDKKILIIVAPLDGSPAQALGVLAGDKILKINGDSTQGITIDEAVGKIRGEAGTVVTLTLYREGEENSFDLPITRAQITVESVKWEDKGDGVAYMRLSRFGDTTNKEWAKSVSEIKTQMPNLKSVVLDVRNNPGGYLDSAVFIASEFMSSGTIVSEHFSDGSKNKLDVSRVGSLTDKDLKIVVLINGGSASASEIVAGALNEKKDAILVGTRSFGKGSVQKAEEFPDGSSLHVTIAKWLTPDLNWVDKANSKFKDSIYNEKGEDGKEIVGGIKPDVEVKLTPENIKDGVDAQLDKAIEIAKEDN